MRHGKNLKKKRIDRPYNNKHTLDIQPFKEVRTSQYSSVYPSKFRNIHDKKMENWYISAPGSGPVTSNNIFGFRTDILLQLLNIKARRTYPGTSNISDIVPMLLKHLYETMEKNDTSVRKDLTIERRRKKTFIEIICIFDGSSIKSCFSFNKLKWRHRLKEAI